MIRLAHCIILFPLISIFMMYSCERPHDQSCDCDQYGVSFNAERKRLGLVALHPGWKSGNDETGACVWKDPEKLWYAEKRLEVDKHGNPINEKDTYYMNYKGLADPDSDSERVKAWFDYDFKKNELTAYTWGSFRDEPYYDVRSSITDRQIDYLHYYCRIPWRQLPKTDTTIFPLGITDTVGNAIERVLRE